MQVVTSRRAVWVRNLSPRQRALLEQWLPGATVESDHSWELVETTVLEVTHAGSRFIAEADGNDDHHIERELQRVISEAAPVDCAAILAEFRHGVTCAAMLSGSGELVGPAVAVGAESDARDLGVTEHGKVVSRHVMG